MARDRRPLFDRRGRAEAEVVGAVLFDDLGRPVRRVSEEVWDDMRHVGYLMLMECPTPAQRERFYVMTMLLWEARRNPAPYKGKPTKASVPPETIRAYARAHPEIKSLQILADRLQTSTRAASEALRGRRGERPVFVTEEGE